MMEVFIFSAPSSHAYTHNSLLFFQSLGLFLVGTIGSSMLCYATPYSPETMPLKVGSFALFTSVMGASMAPLIYIAGNVCVYMYSWRNLNVFLWTVDVA